MKPFPHYPSIAVSSVVVLLTSLTLLFFWPGWRWHHEPLHSTLEALGGLAAIAMALVLFRSVEEQARGKYYSVAVGFLGMGILEILHAMSTPGDGFVFLRTMASLLGGAGFALIGVRGSSEHEGRALFILWAVACGTLASGTWALAFPEQLPLMIRQNDFTSTAIALKSLSCILFFLGAWHFLSKYQDTKNVEDALFASLALIFALAELMFAYSTIWDGSWWFWHFLRLLAYLLVVGYVGHGYLKTVSDLQYSLMQTKRAENILRQVSDEREHIAQNLHDGAIQTIFAVTLSLERCQRLIHHDSSRAIEKIGNTIADLKLVIRDLRSYISGKQFGLAEGNALEAALTSLVHTMNRSGPIQFRVAIDSSETHGLSAEDAQDLLFIAKEAMSNSLRHAEAQSGVVALSKRGQFLRLEVKDNGRAFDTAGSYLQGHGLRNMAARAERLGARFDIRSEQGQGTHIIVEMKKG